MDEKPKLTNDADTVAEPGEPEPEHTEETGDTDDRQPVVGAQLRTTNVLLAILVGIIICGTLKILSNVFVPLVLAIFQSMLILPVMSWLKKRKVPVALTLPATILIFLLGAVLVNLLVLQAVNDIGTKAPEYELRATALISSLEHQLGFDAAEVDFVSEMSTSLRNLVVMIFGSVFSFVANLVLILTLTAFIIVGRKSIAANVHRAFSKGRAEDVLAITNLIYAAVQKYISVKIVVSLATGTAMYLALLFWGVDFAIFWGLLGFLFNFIPTVGSAVAAVLPILLSALQFGSDDMLKVAGIALTLIGIQQLIGNVIEPAIQGRSLNLSPIVILSALLFFGWLWGFWGMLLSVPLVASLKISMEHHAGLRPIAIMMEK